MSEDSSNIRVVCRMRPINALETSLGGETCIEFDDQKISCKVSGTEKPYDFSFDRVFGPGLPQKTIFDTVASPVIDSVMAGYNGTIFCYGQTSSGKTFTMEGPDELTEESKGLIPRMMDRVFELILNASEDLEFQIRVSFLEIYNEKIMDLLDSEKNNLQVKENKVRGIFVQDATEIYVTSAEEMHKAMKLGSKNRTVAATRMNERSSRSHSLFYLQVFKKNIVLDTTTLSKLYFVDLAGSEKISKTNVSGQQLEEAKNINKSLTCLGMVINALTTQGPKEHVPYRDSKLTRVLQESLGGNARTTLVINISMCSYNDKETLSTLRFGFRAKSIQNKAKKNEERSAKELNLLLNQADSKIKYQDEIIQALQLQVQTLQSAPAIEKPLSTQQEKPQTKISRIEGNSDQNSQTMKLLKQHIEIVNLKETINELNQKVSDFEIDSANKSTEIQTLKQDIEELKENKIKTEAQAVKDIVTSQQLTSDIIALLSFQQKMARKEQIDSSESDLIASIKQRYQSDKQEELESKIIEHGSLVEKVTEVLNEDHKSSHTLEQELNLTEDSEIDQLDFSTTDGELEIEKEENGRDIEQQDETIIDDKQVLIEEQQRKIKQLISFNANVQEKISRAKENVKKGAANMKSKFSKQRLILLEKVKKCEDIISTYIRVFDNMNQETAKLKLLLEKETSEKQAILQQLNQEKQNRTPSPIKPLFGQSEENDLSNFMERQSINIIQSRMEEPFRPSVSVINHNNSYSSGLRMSLKQIIRPSIRGGGGNKENFEKNNNALLALPLLTEFEEECTLQTQLSDSIDQGTTPNIRIIEENEDEEDGQHVPIKFNLHKSANKFFDRMKLKHSQNILRADQSINSNEMIIKGQQSPAGDRIAAAFPQNNTQQMNKQTDPGVFNRIKQFFL